MGNFSTAWKAFWQILGNSEKAAAWKELEAGKTQLPPAAPVQPEKPAVAGAEALHLLAILQREARLVDFLEEELAEYDDATVGAICRKVHDDCRKSLDKYFQLGPVLLEEEQSEVEVPAGFDARSIKVTGHPAGDPPYRGILQHHGWRAGKNSLPERNDAQDASVVAPAEVEVG